MDRLITFIGGAGFIGRYAVQELAKTGARLRIVARNSQATEYLKPLGGLGQIQIVRGDVAAPASLAAACAGASAVVNLAGILAETGKEKFDAVQHRGAENVAKAAAVAGAAALVHVSAIGADPAAAPGYARSKADGEAAVRAAFPGATILRPSVVFGPEDGFINRFAGLIRQLPFVTPVIAPGARLQPVYAGDVGRAVAAAIADPARFGGRTFELGGPRVWTMRELNAWIAAETRSPRPLVDVPDAAASLLAALQFLPGAPITRDQLAMLRAGSVARGDGLAELGIAATPLEAIAPAYLVRYRKQGRFNRLAAAG